MTRRPRRNPTSVFKSKVALAAVRGEKMPCPPTGSVFIGGILFPHTSSGCCYRARGEWSIPQL